MVRTLSFCVKNLQYIMFDYHCFSLIFILNEAVFVILVSVSCNALVLCCSRFGLLAFNCYEFFFPTVFLSKRHHLRLGCNYDEYVYSIIQLDLVFCMVDCAKRLMYFGMLMLSLLYYLPYRYLRFPYLVFLSYLLSM